MPARCVEEASREAMRPGEAFDIDSKPDVVDAAAAPAVAAAAGAIRRGFDMRAATAAGLQMAEGHAVAAAMARIVDRAYSLRSADVADSDDNAPADSDWVRTIEPDVVGIKIAARCYSEFDRLRYSQLTRPLEGSFVLRKWYFARCNNRLAQGPKKNTSLAHFGT